MGDADFWELLTKHGIAPDSATAIVKSHGSMQDADLWERLVQNGAQPDAATSIVQSRGATPDKGITARDLARSAGQGASFGFSDELRLADRDAQKAFHKAHPIADVAAKIGGGALLPLVATLGIPALATLGGVVGTGAVIGGLTGAGEAEGGFDKEGLIHRAKSAGIGTVTGAAGGAAGYGASKVLGGLGSALLSRFAPNRAAEKAVGKAASALIDDPTALQAHMDAVNAIAPGTSSPATALRAPLKNNPRFESLIRGTGAGPEASRAAELILTQQRGAQQAAREAIGARMDRLGGDVEVTPSIRSALSKVKSVLGGKGPDAPPPNPADPNPLGLEKSTPFEWDERKTTMSIQDLRDALSRLRFLSRGQAKRGLEANGVDTKSISDARDALQAEVYRLRGDFKTLDRQYAMMSNEMRNSVRNAKTVELSRQNHAANTAYGTSAHSLGGSIHSPTKLAIANALLEKLVPNNRAAVADATTRMILRPGADIASLLNAAPKAGVVGAAARNGLLGPLPAAMRGLLFPADDGRPE